VFLGEYQHSLDAKGRVVLPRKFRDDLEGGCVVTKGQEHCLYLFSLEGWEREVARLSTLPRTDGRARKLTRSFFAAASDQMLDKQGRIQLSDSLRSYASLEKDATIVGVADRVEIWSTTLWQSVSLEADDFYAEIEEVLSEGTGV
jgi:transcriptional regulator MraZ